MIECYEKSLFEQQTPYLQWLKEREQQRNVKKDIVLGKRIIRLPFFSCSDSIEAGIKESADELRDIDFILFTGADGITDKDAEAFIAEYFMQHPKEAIVYADEDYLGTLLEIYGDKTVGNEFSVTYQYDDTGHYRGFPWFKPDYSPDTLRAFFYIGNLFAVRGTALAELLAMWRCTESTAQTHSIYETVLMLTEKTGGAGHISEVLFTNKNVSDREKLLGAGETFIKMKQKLTNGVKMQEATCQKGEIVAHTIENEIKIANVDTKEKIQMLCYPIPQNTFVSVIIPSKDNSRVLKRCLSTLVELTDYPHYEIILVDNGSTQQEQMCIKSFISEIEEDYDLKWANHNSPAKKLRIQYIYQKADFNFSAMCNLGAKAAKGECLLFLNDDMEVIEPFWMRRMLGQALCSHVGAVGAKLYYPNQQKETPYRIQHAGITNMGVGPAHKLAGMEDKGNLYHGRNLVTYNVLAVTAACLMVRKELFWKAEGFDEALAVAYNDVELCFRLYEMGCYNVQRNDVVLLHHESLSRGQDTGKEKQERLKGEKRLLYEKHPELEARDPFYSEHLVQWKKDAEYTCNYLYPYDKVIKPTLLEQSETAKFPREHQNKLLRKLMGENLFMLQIDSIEKAEEDEKLVIISGWFVMRERDNAIIDKKLLLKNTENGAVYQLTWYPKLRYDVERLFQNEAGGQKKGTGNTALSGIQIVLEQKVLAQGRYIIGVLTDEKKGLCAKKICWRNDYVLEIS